MLGYTQPNNDVYVFFENDEIERASKEKIQGSYFNLRDLPIIGLLEVFIDDSIKDSIETETEKDERGLVKKITLKIRTREHQKIMSRGTCELHQGFRHICLRDANRLSFPDELNYRQLKYWEAEFVS